MAMGVRWWRRFIVTLSIALACLSLPAGMPGSGGRIAVVAAASVASPAVALSMLNIIAFGGLAADGTGSGQGTASAGTIFFDVPKSVAPVLIVNNTRPGAANSVPTTAYLLPDSFAPMFLSRIDLRGQASLQVQGPANGTKLLFNNVTSDATGVLALGANVTASMGMQAFVGDVYNPTLQYQYLSATTRGYWFSQQWIAMTAASLISVNVTVAKGASLVLPDALYVCNAFILPDSTGSGNVTGAGNVTQCPQYRAPPLPTTLTVSGCKNASATNFMPSATIRNDALCRFPSTAKRGCTYPVSPNFDPAAVVNDGEINAFARSCLLMWDACTTRLCHVLAA